ncbi:hypothetical protein Zmor_017413 [Zophobas morio]|uniref:Uncharacterized protein n=1 Tax=Zophobas morio TaxID=2755281 RepID=A0AA38I9N4_9CUCU|nr:hypothetical protein Zmor_017413 [Zophobas morio]
MSTKGYILVTSTLSWCEDALSTTRNANKMVYLLAKEFASSHVSVNSKVYKSYASPVLEFAKSPILQRNIELLESVQRRPQEFHLVEFGQSMLTDLQ